jgi:hypothetical protein
MRVNQETGARYVRDLDYEIVDKPTRIRWISIWRDGFPDWGWRTVATIDFLDVPGGTEVTLTHEGFKDAITRDHHAQGWGGGPNKLAKFLGDRA